MVEMAAAMAILLITSAVLLSLLLGMPWWLQVIGVLLAIAGLAAVSRWLVRETLGARVAHQPSLPELTVDFEYLDAEGKLRHCAVEVGRVREDYFEGASLNGGMHHVFFLTRVKGLITDRRSGRSLPPKVWAAEHRFETTSSVAAEA